MSSICPSCRAAVHAADAFCESCGTALVPDAVPAAEAAVDPLPVPPTVSSPAPGAYGACAACGGDVLDDGFCSVCGQRAGSPRDHWREEPVAWLGGVCDRGVVHSRNEDAMALAGLADGTLGVLVVCDGVTSAPDSDRASLAAARDACATLVATPPSPGTGVAATVSHWSSAIARACADANAAAVGVAHSLGDPVEPPSCTFVAAVVANGVATVGWCGDSRAYWLPDAGEPRLLTEDHSLGTEMVRSGMSREQAERDPAFHTITRWLGADSADPTAEVASCTLDTAGWLLVCSDGLWNYASSAAAVRVRVAELAEASPSPAALAAALVGWANEQGGHDNITAAVARWEPSVR